LSSPGGYLHPGDAQVPIVTKDRELLDLSFFGPSVRLLIIRRAREHPWVVGTSFHQSGGCELGGVEWDGRTLRGELLRPPGAHGRIFIVAPGFEPGAASINGDGAVTYRGANGSLVLPVQTGDETLWEIRFDPV
jgi:hypothetical protein